MKKLILAAFAAALALAPGLALAQTSSKTVTTETTSSKREPMTKDAAMAAITAAGYTNVTALSQHGKGNWHAMAVPPAGGAPVAVVVDKHGHVHQGDVDPD